MLAIAHNVTLPYGFMLQLLSYEWPCVVELRQSDDGGSVHFDARDGTYSWGSAYISKTDIVAGLISVDSLVGNIMDSIDEWMSRVAKDKASRKQAA